MRVTGFVELGDEERRFLAYRRMQKFFPHKKSRPLLAQKLGIAARTLASYEQGDRRPTIETFIKWSSILGVPHAIVGSILGGYDAGDDQTRTMGAKGHGLAVPHSAAGAGKADPLGLP